MSKSGGRGKRPASRSSSKQRSSKKGRPAPKRNRPAPKVQPAPRVVTTEVDELADDESGLLDDASSEDATALSPEERRAQKRQRRFARQEAEAARAQRAKRQKRRRRLAYGGVAVIAAALGGFFLLQPDPEVDGAEKLRDRGRRHVGNPSYDTVAPTSGPHAANPAACGTTTSPVALGLAVHNLEHGAVVIWYDPATVPDEDVAQIETMLRSNWNSHWLLSPRPELPSEFEEPIVATAWNRRMAFEDPADPVLEEFASTYRNRGPERVACDIQHQ